MYKKYLKRTTGRAANSGHQGVSAGLGGVASGGLEHLPGADGSDDRGWTSNRSATPVRFPATARRRQRQASELGRATTNIDERTRGEGVPAAMGRTGARWWSVSAVSDSSGVGATLGTEGGQFGRLPVSGSSWLA